MPALGITLKGMPYVPGFARGVLQRELTGEVSGRILVLGQDDLGSLPMLPAGFIVVEGAPLSHRMIRLFGLGVPTVIISARQSDLLAQGVEVGIDGSSGSIGQDVYSAADSLPARSLGGNDGPLTTSEGVQVHLCASARSAEAAREAVVAGADAIGLVRSEFLLPEDGSPPTVEYYQQAFGEICAAATPLPVTVRLLDLSADKMPDWMPFLKGSEGPLGLQGVRLFRAEPVKSVYRAQLCAIDRLSREFDLRILIPYLVRYEEMCDWVEDIRARLSIPVPIGAMAESPVAALDLGNWLDRVEFAAVGCNDLMQCLFAADRDRPELGSYLDPYAPPLFRFLSRLAEGVSGRLCRVQLCGLLPQIPGVLPILLGLGFRAFSVESKLVHETGGFVSYLGSQSRD